MQLAIIALCVYLVSARESFISLQDEQFDREDPRILAELKRRTNHDRLIRAFRPRNIKFPTQPTKPRKTGNRSPVPPPAVTKFRRYYGFGTERHHSYPFDIVERASRHKMIEIAEQAIYGAQYRMKDLEPIAKKYEDKLEFRINFIFKRMETIESELEFIYSHMYKAGQMWDATSGAKMRVYLYIVYYEMVLMKNVDIQYMCDHLFELHMKGQKTQAAIMERQKMLQNLTNAGIGGQGGLLAQGGASGQGGGPGQGLGPVQGGGPGQGVGPDQGGGPGQGVGPDQGGGPGQGVGPDQGGGPGQGVGPDQGGGPGQGSLP